MSALPATELTVDLQTTHAAVTRKETQLQVHVDMPGVVVGIPGGSDSGNGSMGPPGPAGPPGPEGPAGTVPEGTLLGKNNPNITLDADDETFATWVVSDGGTPTGGWPNRGGFSFVPNSGETVDTFQWNEYGELRCIAAKATTVGLRVFVKQFNTSAAHTANVFEVQDDRTNRNVLVAISANGTLTARNVDRKVVTFATGSEPSTVGQPDGTLWVEYTP